MTPKAQPAGIAQHLRGESTKRTNATHLEQVFRGARHACVKNDALRRAKRERFSPLPAS
ncbi:hypothetical protein AKJ09_00841 [Labilithrix luteola]|uniref:Uncharacterized protein n=1 Tax=Labilithrix luteola TaxID=1391654 RepID=A0A0K1PKX9_9BACT|nr:hypothetical protein AKJ09_00841 [Labilithrix luteola]